MIQLLKNTFDVALGWYKLLHHGVDLKNEQTQKTLKSLEIHSAVLLLSIGLAVLAFNFIFIITFISLAKISNGNYLLSAAVHLLGLAVAATLGFTKATLALKNIKIVPAVSAEFKPVDTDTVLATEIGLTATAGYIVYKLVKK